MPASLASLLEASVVLIVLPFFSQGKVNIDQVEFVDGVIKSWPVDGVATVELGTGRDFAFDCGLSNEPSSCFVVWGRTDFQPVSQHYTGKPQQVQLQFDESTPASLGEYVCDIMGEGCSSEQSVFLTITEANPAVLPVQQDRLLTASVGDSISIEFKISSLPEVKSSNIKWFHENSPISTTENLREDSKSLVIDNVQLSDAGHYQVEVCVSSQCEVQHTNLSVNDLFTTTTSQIILPTATSSNTPSPTPIPSSSPSTSSSIAPKDTSLTLGHTLSSSNKLTTPSSSRTTLPLLSTTAVPPFRATLVHSMSLTDQPSILQTTPTVSSTCSTTTEEQASLGEYLTLVTAGVVLLVTALIAVIIAMLIVLLVRRRGRKFQSSEESSFTESKDINQNCDSKDINQICDSKGYTTDKGVNGHSNAAFRQIILSV